MRSGDTLALIAQRQNTTISALATANGISNTNLVRIGQFLTLPASLNVSSQASNAPSYRVRWGDTLTGIADRFGVTAASIRALNPSLGYYLLAGSWIRVCSSCLVSDSSNIGTGLASGARYLVRAGDTLYGIAARYGIAPATLAASNRIGNWGKILVGAWLAIPSGQGEAAGAQSTASTSGAGIYDPSSARSLIVRWANAYGISASLPLAIAWQESGFNQTVISPTGAIGVMQVEPYTGVLASQYVGRPLYLSNLDDNIHAGVFWITHLLVYYGWNERLAIAAYYQGTKALARFGFYDDTVTYVNNVLALQSRFGG